MTADQANALVLGGGGPLGIAWEAGMLAGWAEQWAALSPTPHLLELLGPNSAPGTIIGTSAGSIVGAHLSVLGHATGLATNPTSHLTEKLPSLTRFFLAMFKARLLTRSKQSMRKSMGRSALRLAVPGLQQWVNTIQHFYAPSGEWPQETRLLIAVINAQTGEFHAWNSSSGIALPLAIAASCAVPCVFPLVPIGHSIYMDGGIGSPTNAHLAQGCGRALILDPLGRIMGESAPLVEERRFLEQDGTRTASLMPSRAVAQAIGRHWLDHTRYASVAELALAQGHSTAASVLAFLSDTKYD